MRILSCLNPDLQERNLIKQTIDDWLEQYVLERKSERKLESEHVIYLYINSGLCHCLDL